MQLNGTSINGSIKCKLQGPKLPHNGDSSVTLSDVYGRTILQSSAQHISATGDLYSFQSHAIIESITPTNGSEQGGQLITITGQFFDQTVVPAKILIGEGDCGVESLTTTEIVCRTTAKPFTAPATYPGRPTTLTHSITL